MIEVPDDRPDGRGASPETLRLRRATRALRLHLDEVPIVYDLDVSGDRFLAGLSFMSARHRYGCADSMIGAGFGGTVIGSLARSLFVDGLRWLWIDEEPERRRSLLGALLLERHRLCELLEDNGASIDNLPRWFMPLPDVADLTGTSMSWLDTPSLPSDEALLEDFLKHRESAAAKGDKSSRSALVQRTHQVLDMSGLRGAVMVLAHAGHGNFLGLLSSFAEGGAVGHDLRPDHEALFMQVASAGATATLLGVTAAVPELWPPEVEQQPFLERAVELTAEVAAAAVPIHGLDTSRRPAPQGKKNKKNDPGQRRVLVLRPGAVLSADDLRPDVSSIHHVAEATEAYRGLTLSLPLRLWDNGNPTLHAALTYGGGHSNLEAVMATYQRPGSGPIAVFAARMLLEEAARMVWCYSLADPTEFVARAKQYFDEFRARQKKTINTLTGSSVSRVAAEQIFARPNNVRVESPDNEIASGRAELPKIGKMLREMGAPFPPGRLAGRRLLPAQPIHAQHPDRPPALRPLSRWHLAGK